MQGIMSSIYGKGAERHGEFWLKSLIVLVTVASICGVFMSTNARAANKPDLGGYTGAEAQDAQYIIQQLPEPTVKPGFKFKVGYLNGFAELMSC